MCDGISDNEECCLNCEYWRINTQLHGPADGVICTLGNGHTAPGDYCMNFRIMDNRMDYFYAPGASRIEKNKKISYYLSWLE